MGLIPRQPSRTWTLWTYRSSRETWTRRRWREWRIEWPRPGGKKWKPVMKPVASQSFPRRNAMNWSVFEVNRRRATTRQRKPGGPPRVGQVARRAGIEGDDFHKSSIGRVSVCDVAERHLRVEWWSVSTMGAKLRDNRQARSLSTGKGPCHCIGHGWPSVLDDGVGLPHPWSSAVRDPSARS